MEKTLPLSTTAATTIDNTTTDATGTTTSTSTTGTTDGVRTTTTTITTTSSTGSITTEPNTMSSRKRPHEEETTNTTTTDSNKHQTTGTSTSSGNGNGIGSAIVMDTAATTTDSIATATATTQSATTQEPNAASSITSRTTYDSNNNNNNSNKYLDDIPQQPPHPTTVAPLPPLPPAKSTTSSNSSEPTRRSSQRRVRTPVPPGSDVSVGTTTTAAAAAAGGGSYKRSNNDNGGKRKTAEVSSSSSSATVAATTTAAAAVVVAVASTTATTTRNRNTHQEQMQLYIQSLPPLQTTIPTILALDRNELEELEFVLEFYCKFSAASTNSSGGGGGTSNRSSRNNSPVPGSSSISELNKSNDDSSWKDDWVGNLAMVDKDIINPAVHKSYISSNYGRIATSLQTSIPSYPKKVVQQRQSLLEWAMDANTTLQSRDVAIRYIRMILRHVCTLTTTTTDSVATGSTTTTIPSTIKKIFGTITDKTSISDIVFRIRRVSYDPRVLQEDGWTIQKSSAPVGATGGPYLIGDTILSDNAVAIIIAYLYDADIGDLWKALFIDDEYLSFDLEAEELFDAKRKYTKKYGSTTAIPTTTTATGSSATSTNVSSTRTTTATVGNATTDKTATVPVVGNIAPAVAIRTPSTVGNSASTATGSTNSATKMTTDGSKATSTTNTTAATIPTAPSKRPTRLATSNDFTVNNIEYGIVLAASYSKGARQNVYWPARVMHASENSTSSSSSSSSSNNNNNTAKNSNGGTTNMTTSTTNTTLNATTTSTKRNSLKQKVDVVFLSPYWTSDDIFGASRQRRIIPDMSSLDDGATRTNPLLMIETIDANDDRIKEFPFSASPTLSNTNDSNNINLVSSNGGLDIGQLRTSFRFTGLPKSIFPRYLDAHRIAMALQLYAKNRLILSPSLPHHDRATTGSFDTHPMAVQVPTFPNVVLHLPFHFVLSKLPDNTLDNHPDSIRNGNVEPILNLETMVKSMTPPYCWETVNARDSDQTIALATNATDTTQQQHQQQPDGAWMNGDHHDTFAADELVADADRAGISNFMMNYPLLNDSFNRYYNAPPLVGVLSSLRRLLSQLGEAEEEQLASSLVYSAHDRALTLQSFVASWTILKRLGEESLASLLPASAGRPVIMEWRRAAEQIYHFIVGMFTDEKEIGNGLSIVVTDPSCNEHFTSSGSLERPVRLPAAVKGAKLAGAGTRGKMARFITAIPAQYTEYTENKILPKTHDMLYLRRMKSRCAAARTDDEVLVLTDDSEGEGGEDTVGSRGTWHAAVTGVAAAIAATDMVVRGQCVNAFCIVRPPGHHAGRKLHPMKAISNGFCILNAVACAAIHATLPHSEGGLGLSRVCIFDFDAHHGNGTQDILCSTYDPRFLYISLHAGGSEINGDPMDDDPDHELHDLASHPKLSGIFPGRCGDTSPHDGVLNIPLGAQVTPHAIGMALNSQVAPKVESFSPDLILLSAGFDAHKNDPMGLGALRAEDFGHITQAACELAILCCSGRIVSVLEGGYGVPCCRPQNDLFLPKDSPEKEPKAKSRNNTRDVGGTKTTDSINGATMQKDDLYSDPTTTTATNDAIGTALMLGNVTTESAVNDNTTATATATTNTTTTTTTTTSGVKRPQPTKLLDLGDDLPDSMDDQVPYALQARLEKCHQEGFVACVFHHVQSLVQCNRLR